MCEHGRQSGVYQLVWDLTNAFDALKIAILNHKLAGWEDVSCDDVCAALNAMKQLAMNK
ncbi:MAG: hypothetical protein IKS45_00260 [Thermoguttaceae bacterium]|nr:hypothetical protein [Thermoguttaceae bacterium]